uniref:SPOC domain-containing protein n=1 Tax=Clytia hemisphaerica TaxID=252671 RepID=A0A7M5UXY6_9CNID
MLKSNVMMIEEGDRRDFDNRNEDRDYNRGNRYGNENQSNYTLLTEGEEEEAMVIITGIEIQRIVLIAGGVGHVVVAQSMVTEMNQGDVIPHQEEPVHKRPPLIIIQNPYQRFQNLQIQKKKPEKPVSNSVEPYDSSKPQESLVDIAKRFVVAWKGAFALKNSAFPVRMHLIGGNPDIANFYLRGIGTGAGPAIKILNITQRLRLDQPKLDEVSRRVQQSGAGGHCMLLALPTGDEVELEVSYQRRPLKSLVTYFKKKEAAGVILMSSAEGPEGKLEETGMLHAFPPCEFSQQQLLKAAPNAGADPLNEDHLVIVVVKGTTS